jgi:hypothetical protein
MAHECPDCGTCCFCPIHDADAAVACEHPCEPEDDDLADEDDDAEDLPDDLRGEDGDDGDD